MTVQMLFCSVLLPEFLQNHVGSLCSLSSVHCVKFQVVQLYNSTDTATAMKNSHLILSWRSDFLMVINLSIAIHFFPMR